MKAARLRSAVAACVVAFLAPVLLWCGYQAVVVSRTNVLGWADERSVASHTFNEFSTRFGTPEFFVAAWPTELRDDPSFPRVAERLRSGNDAGYFATVADHVSVLDELEASSEKISRDAAVNLIQGAMLSLDGAQGCVVATLSPAGAENRTAAVRAVLHAAEEEGVSTDAVRVGGIAAELAWLEMEGVNAPLRLIPFSCLMCLTVCCACLRSARFGALVTGVSCLSGLTVLAFYVVSGVPMDAVGSTLPSLGLVLTASLAIHWVGYFNASDNESIEGAADEATRQSFAPGALSIVTTCAGLLSLSLSETSAIRHFGCFGAAAALAAGVWALGVFPVLTPLLGVRPKRRRASRRRYVWLWSRINRSRGALIGASVIALAAAGIGVSQLSTTVRLDGFFRGRHAALRDAHWLEDHLFPLGRLEVDVTIATEAFEDDGYRMLYGIQALRELEIDLSRSGAATAPFSARRLAPPLPAARGTRGVAERSVYVDALKKQEGRLREMGLFTRDASGDHWRLSAPTSTLDHNDRRTYTERSRLIEEVGTRLQNRMDGVTSVRVTGVPLLMELIERQFLNDLFLTYGVSVGLIFVVVWIGFGSASLAALAMLPNVFPPLLVLGIAGGVGMALDVGSIMTASIALGIAVDDTVHFLVGVRRRIRLGRSAEHAVRATLAHTGPAIVQTSLLGACGLLILGVSPFLPTARFGSLMALMMLAALIGDLVLLPALLTTRWGTAIARRSAQPRPAAESPPPTDPIPEGAALDA